MDRDVEKTRVSLICVDPRQVHRIWPHLAPILRDATARTGLSAFAEIEHGVLSGNALLWLAVSGGGTASVIEAAASTILQQTDAGKACVITACAGKEMTRWLHLIAGIEAYARDEDCRCVRIFGREGWRRVLEGYRKTHIVMDKRLT